MEGQLKEQNSLDKMNDVLLEIPKVRKDLGYIPLVTPTSQIVGTQAVLNVLTGERYKTITKESSGVLKGEYGLSPAAVNKDLQNKVLAKGENPIKCRPADNIKPELNNLELDFDKLVKEKNIKIADAKIDDLLTYALFPQVGIKFLENRDNPDYFEKAPEALSDDVKKEKEGVYTVSFEGNSYLVNVSKSGDINSIQMGNNAIQSTQAQLNSTPQDLVNANAEEIKAPLSGNIFKVLVNPNHKINEGDTLIVLEAMKMETDIKASRSGTVVSVNVKEGDSVNVGDILLSIV